MRQGSLFDSLLEDPQKASGSRSSRNIKKSRKNSRSSLLEAVRAWFKKAWQEHDYTVIVAVADKIPNNVLEEDPKRLMWYGPGSNKNER